MDTETTRSWPSSWACRRPAEPSSCAGSASRGGPSSALLSGRQLYGILREAVDAGKTVLFYVPWPFFSGYVNVKVDEAMMLLRNRDEDIQVDMDVTTNMLCVHADKPIYV